MLNDLRATTFCRNKHDACSSRTSQGFTLAELLIAVAIIGSLVSIAIPLFGSQQSLARRRTDETNFHAAKEAATAQWLADGMPEGASYCYKLGVGDKHGTAVEDAPEGYGQSTAADWNGIEYTMEGGGDPLPVADDGTPRFVLVTFNAEGIDSAVWSNSDGGSGNSSTVYTGSSGTSGSIGNSTTSSTPGGGSGDDGSGSTPTGALQKAAIVWGTSKKPTYIGDVYLYNGLIYVSLAYEERDYALIYSQSGEDATPSGAWYQGRFVTPTGTVYTSADTTTRDSNTVISRAVSYGDIYQDDDGYLYICKGGSDWGLTVPPQNTSNWVKINGARVSSYG